MDRLQRIYKLHQIIAAHRLPVPHSLLQEKLECSRATVNRIIEEMRRKRSINGVLVSLSEFLHDSGLQHGGWS